MTDEPDKKRKIVYMKNQKIKTKKIQKQAQKKTK